MKKAPVALSRADGSTVCERCTLAETPPARLKGLLGQDDLPPGEGLLIRPSNAIHTAFMRFPIDAVFLDSELRVLRIVADLPPWRYAGRRRAHSVLELAAGECARRRLVPGDQLVLGVHAVEGEGVPSASPAASLGC